MATKVCVRVLRLFAAAFVMGSALVAVHGAAGHQQYGSNTATAWRVPWRAGTDQFPSGNGFNTSTHVGSEL